MAHVGASGCREVAGGAGTGKTPRAHKTKPGRRQEEPPKPTLRFCWLRGCSMLRFGTENLRKKTKTAVVAFCFSLPGARAPRQPTLWASVMCWQTQSSPMDHTSPLKKINK